jgi:hypothetical protein
MSEGERVPVVFWPRFTALTGAAATEPRPFTEYHTTPMDMLGFNQLSLTVFRSKMVTSSGTPAIEFQFEESTDLVSYAPLGTAFDPTEGVNIEGEKPFVSGIARRYVRLRVRLTGPNDMTATIFAIGWAARTQS